MHTEENTECIHLIVMFCDCLMKAHELFMSMKMMHQSFERLSLSTDGTNMCLPTKAFYIHKCSPAKTFRHLHTGICYDTYRSSHFQKKMFPKFQKMMKSTFGCFGQ